MEENKIERKHDINEIAKACSAGEGDDKVFNELITIDMAMRDLLANDKVYEQIKNKTVAEIETASNRFGNVRITLILKNDETAKKEIETLNAWATDLEGFKKTLKALKEREETKDKSQIAKA